MFPDLKIRNYDYIDPARLSSLTCEQLGIPRDEKKTTIRQIRNTSLHIDGIRYEAMSNSKLDPFSPYCMIPLPEPLSLNIIEPTCVRRRNERERDRVRCVNDGYLKLKEHLPIENKEKRISKVETLRCAIQYIKHLEHLLNDCEDCAKKQSDNNFTKDDYVTEKGRTSKYENGFVSDSSDYSDSKYRSFSSEDDADISADTSDCDSYHEQNMYTTEQTPILQIK